jgi:NAD(P)H dehydrogenase (quinone)
MTGLVVIYDSGFGHTAMQARAVTEGALRVPGLHARMLFAEDAASDIEQLAPIQAMVFGCPTYMASASAGFKRFMEASSSIWLDQGWKDKVAGGFTNSGGQSGDKLSTLIQLMLFAAQHGMVWVGLGLPDGNNSSEGSAENLNRLGAYAGAMAQSNVDAGMEGMYPSDLETARLLGERVARAAVRWQARDASCAADTEAPAP